MNFLQNISISDYDYNLPEEKIAKFPLAQRDKSKLVIFRNNQISESVFQNITDFLSEESLLVFNETKVVQARLNFYKETGSKIEIFCIEPFFPTEIQLAFQQKKSVVWKCMIGNLKKWKSGELAINFELDGKFLQLKAKKKEVLENALLIEFFWQPEDLTFAEILDLLGVVPLPPYLKRQAIDSDKERYQTVFAKNNGSVAAPTAGLHFTENVFKSFEKKNIKTDFITLHVSAGTFKPVSTPTIKEHQMHTEHIAFSKDNIMNLLENLHGNIIPVGTTSMRTLESVYWFGVDLITKGFNSNFEIKQWQAYENNYGSEISASDSLGHVLKFMTHHNLELLTGTTQLIIVPGYKFRIAKGLLTNFHMPKSTLLLLVAALIGDSWKNVYDYCLKNNFRFLSYGDSCLFFA